MIRKLLLLFLLIIIPKSISAQAPGNTCGTAVGLTLPTVVGNTISTGAQTTNGNGNNYAAGTYCPNGNYGNGEDGVYSINVTSTNNYTFDFPNSGNRWKVFSIHSGCNPTLANCIGGFVTGGGRAGTYTTTLTPGTYYLVIDTWPNPNSANFTLNITLNPPPSTPPANDDPCGATPLGVGPTCTFSTHTTANATASVGVPAPGCANYAGGDIWFEVTIPASGNIFIDTSDLDFTDSGMAAYSGATCSSLTLITCDDDGGVGFMSAITLTGRTPGETIYIRVWEYGNDDSGEFEICVSEPPTPPTNDECSAAIALTVNSDYNCGAVSFGTTVGATASAQIDDVTGTPNNDIWYSFIATNTAHRISLINIVAVTGSTDMGIGVYDGSSGCNALVFEDDSDPETLDLTGLTIGNLYYVRIYGWFNDPTDQVNLEVCVGTPPPPPPYDDPCNAEPLTVNTSCSFSTYTTESATTTPTAGIPDPGCGSYNGGDVWFTVTVPSSGSIIVDTDTGVVTDSGMAIYSVNTACPSLNLNLIECDDDDSPNGFMSRIELTGQTPGATLYVRFWEYGNDNNGEFDICAYEPSPPTNDDCANAVLLTSDTNCLPTTGTTEFATQSQAGCTGNADDDVWFYFVATGTEHTITVEPNTLNDAVFQVFDGSCAGTSLSCMNNTTLSDNETLTLSSLTPGTSYYIRVYSNGGNGNQGLFDICITEPCSTVITDAPPSCTLIADDTNNDPFSAVPFVADPEVSIDCDTGEAVLEAFSNFHETTSYRVERIPYSVNSSLGGGLTSQVIPNDDIWASNSTSIGFDFCFYGQTYTHFLVGANGNITFDINDPGNGLTGTNTPGDYCGWQFDENLPSTDASLVDYAIYGVYHDIDPRGLIGNPIQSELVGSGNCRRMIISWTDIPMFDDATRLYSGRIELYESTNIIEVHIEEKLIENGDVSPWNDGNAIVGIQGNSATGEAVTAPCRGIDPNWEVLNTSTTREAWRFVPDGAARVPSSVTWYTGSVGGTQVGTNNTLTVNTANTYYVEATYPTCSGNITVDDAIVVTDPRKVWDGSVDSNWYVANNWTPSGVPDLNDCVVIPDQTTTPNDPIANQSIAPLPITPITPAMARNLTLQANSYLEVETNTELLIRDWINIQSTGIFNLKSSASLIQMDDSATNTGTIHVQRSPNFDESAIGNAEYVYWSSPVNNFQVTDVSPTSTAIYDWIPTAAGNGIGNHGEWSVSTGAMADATGYIIRGLGGTPGTIPSTGYTIPNNTALFSGVPNNGVFTKQIFHGGYNGAPYAGNGNTATNEDDNWNLIGNPYPSAISANAFTNANSNINGTVYLWPHSSAYSAITGDPFYEDYAYNYDGNDYIEHNNTGSNPPGTNDLFIGSGQGFFVLMNHGATSGSSVTFNNSMRYDDTIDDLINGYDNSNFFRMNDFENNEDTTDRNRIWLDLLSPNAVTNSILVGYVDNATNEFDRLYDGYDFSDDNSGFYSILDDEELSIQGRTLPFNQEDRVPLGIVANANGIHTIAINTVDGFFLDSTQNIYIEDTDLNIIHDLREAPYTFTSSEGVHNNRFILRYTDATLSVNSFDKTEDLEIMAPKSKYFRVTSEISAINSITIYDIVGKVIYENQEINTYEFTHKDSKLSSGTYIVKVKLVNGKQKQQKLILKIYK